MPILQQQYEKKEEHQQC